MSTASSADPLAGASGLRIFGGPQRYVQGPGALSVLPSLTAALGGRPVVVADAFVQTLLRRELETCFPNEDLPSMVVTPVEITYPAIEATTELVRRERPGVVVGAGGGKALDIAKGVAAALHLPLVTVPTIASNDAPTSKVYVVYDDAHELVGVEHMEWNPAAVVVDTRLICAAPKRFFLAGIGDAVSKKFEAEASHGSGAMNLFGGRPLVAALSLAETCHRLLLARAEEAVAALDQGRPTAALEDVVEATVFLSGLAFENGGLSLAHAMTRGLSAAPATARALHGEQVAYGILVQLFLEPRPDALAELLAFHRRIGLPSSLRQLAGRAVAADEFRLIADRTMGAPHTQKMPRPVTAQMMVEAMRHLESIGAPGPA